MHADPSLQCRLLCAVPAPLRSADSSLPCWHLYRRLRCSAGAQRPLPPGAALSPLVAVPSYSPDHAQELAEVLKGASSAQAQHPLCVIVWRGMGRADLSNHRSALWALTETEAQREEMGRWR
ncbi:hypothetical protein NDU88_008659 [Pleurodeles waltl]|uniref:Uncharacterized protein n=1 Tax=Pleurodeles waltl TaxID=8319 RepID=A0AAV7N5K4_PLEWA|nr:hypothetical protein NDU88_008659 [Pleurodeles waltl]